MRYVSMSRPRNVNVFVDPTVLLHDKGHTESLTKVSINTLQLLVNSSPEKRKSSQIFSKVSILDLDWPAQGKMIESVHIADMSYLTISVSIYLF